MPLANPITRRIVIADPHFAARIAGHGATHFTSIAPDELRVVAADAGAGIGAIAVVARFRCPIDNHVGGASTGSGDLKEILAEDGARAMVKLPLVKQMDGPLLGVGGQTN